MSSKDQMFAKVILASKPTNGAPPIITMHLRYPRIIHSELMTHRVFSRNARSSRAVPVKTMLEEVRNAPFVPWHWGKNQKGMQADEECNELVRFTDSNDGFFSKDFTREAAWLRARDQAVSIADAFADAGYHKQIANRLLEPFMFIDVLVTSTSWANFLFLRDHKDAEPHIHDLAVLVQQTIAGAEYQTLEPGEWHIPYFQGVKDYQEAVNYLRNVAGVAPTDDRLMEVYKKVSVARCARISYTPFDGEPSIERELERYDLLVGSTPLHASPAEHQATPDERCIEDYSRNSWSSGHLAGNLGGGYIQYRKTLPGEYVADAA